MTIIDDFLQSSRRYGDLPAIEQRESQVSYGELAARASAIAEALAEHGVVAKDVVAVHGVPSFGVFSAALGAMMAESVLLMLDTRLPAARKRYMLDSCGARVLILAGPTDDDLTSGDRLLIDGSGRPIGFVDGDRSHGKPGQCVAYEDPAYIFFTSGSTGEPRAVLGSHRGLKHFIDWQRQTFEVGPGDRVAQLTSLAFDVVLRDIFLPLTSGSTLCLPDQPGSMAGSVVFAWMNRVGVTRLHTVPSIAQAWLNMVNEPQNLTALKTAFFAGEPLTDVLLKRWRKTASAKCEIVNLYGPTETTLAKFFYRVPRAGIKRGIQPVGLPLPGCEAIILDETDKPSKGRRIVGQIALKTKFCSYGYLNSREETARRFRSDSSSANGEEKVFLTGDLGRISRTGLLQVLGRIDNQVKINGVRVELEEISALLVRHPGVASAVTIAAAAAPDSRKSLCCYWVQGGVANEPTEDELREFLRAYLSDGVIPSSFIRIDALPLTANGKVDRAALPRPDIGATIEPRTQSEQRLLPVWRSILTRNGRPVTASLFSAGASSLEIAELQFQIEKEIGISLPLTSIISEATFAGIGRLIEDAEQGGGFWPAILPAAEERDFYPLTPWQKGSADFQLADRDRAWNSVVRVLPFGCAVSKEMVERALRAMCERHQNLRITFHEYNGEWIQVLNSAQDVAVDALDLRDVSSSERISNVEVLRRTYSAMVLDPDQWPLFRATLVQFGENDSRLIFVINHAVCDGYSLDILWQEIRAFVETSSNGNGLSLQPLESQFLDFVMWRISEPVINRIKSKSRQYWIDLFGDYRERVELTFDGDGISGARAAGYRRLLSETLSRRIYEMGRVLNCSSFTILFTGFFLAFHDLTGRRDIILKTVSSGRSFPFLSRMIGNFATAIHIRSSVGDQTSFAELANRIKEGVARGIEHQEYQFHEVLEEFGVALEDRLPLASVFLNPINGRSSPPSNGFDEHCEDTGSEEKCDLMGYVRLNADAIELDFHYRKALYSAATIRKLVDLFVAALERATLEPFGQIRLSPEGKLRYPEGDSSSTSMRIGAAEVASASLRQTSAPDHSGLNPRRH